MKTLIFDFDGTIADSFDYVFAFLASQGHPARTFSHDERQMFRHRSMPTMARQLGIRWWQLPHVWHKGRREMRRHLNQVGVFTEMPPLIRELRGQGYRLMILSSNTEPTIREFLRRHEIDDFFEDVHGKVGLFGKGPALRQMLAKHGLHVDDCVYIGDEVRDVKSAHAVRIDCIAVTWGFADPNSLRGLRPYAVAASSAELRAAIGRFATE